MGDSFPRNLRVGETKKREGEKMDINGGMKDVVTENRHKDGLLVDSSIYAACNAVFNDTAGGVRTRSLRICAPQLFYPEHSQTKQLH